MANISSELFSWKAFSITIIPLAFKGELISNAC